MKRFLILSLFVIALITACFSQNIKIENLLGVYFADKDNKIQISLCERNEWYYTNNCVSQGNSNHGYLNTTINQRSIERIGYSFVSDSIICLKDWNDILFFELKIIDTLNLQVVYSKETFETGEYLNRAMSFFSGSFCGNYMANTHLIRWEISDHNLIRYNEIGGWFNSPRTVQRLTNRYWLRN
jgi:hypothetical protein